MNVLPAWQKGFTGRGVVVTILDDGIEKDHPDLKKNYVSTRSQCISLSTNVDPWMYARAMNILTFVLSLYSYTSCREPSVLPRML